MKKLSLLLCFCSLWVLELTAQDWAWLNPYPQNNSLKSIQFIGEDKGWAVGLSGIVVLTEDGGETWQAIQNVVCPKLNSIHMLNEQIGWAVGDDYSIIHTIDGGHNWEQQFYAEGNGDLFDVFVIDALTVWAVIKWSNRVIYTTNGGETWQEKELEVVADNAAIFFSDAQTGWIAGETGRIYGTTDGGNTWESQNFMPSIKFYDIFFIDGQTGWAVGSQGGDGVVYKTTNGSSWILMEETNHPLIDVHFVNSQVGFCATPFSIVYKTTDGGNNWTQQLPDSESQAVHFINENKGFSVGGFGEMATTEDGGETWAQINNGWPHSWTGVTSLGNDIWVTGQTGVYHSPDAGQTWENQEIFILAQLCDIHFWDENTGITVGFNGRVNRTTDGGQTWEYENLGNFQHLASMSFVGQKGWMVGRFGLILHSNDGGATWVEQESGISQEDLKEVQFINELEGWICGNNALVLHTIDGGQNWEIQPTQPELYQELNSLYFVNEEIGWAAGGDELIIHTNDGGETWTVQNEPEMFSGHFTSITFADTQNGWAIETLDCNFFSTNDGGQTWHQSPIPSGGLVDLNYTENGDLIAVGAGGAILHLKDVMTDVQSPAIPSSEEIVVFPNPSTGQIQISGSLDFNNWEVTVYDLQGKLLLEDKDLLYKSVDLSFLENGLYLLKFSNGTTTKHSRVVLQKN